MNDELQRLWHDGNLLEIGRTIFESIPPDRRPAWAASILDLCRSHHSPVPAVDSLSDIANDPQRWREAHDAFDTVRDLTLALHIFCSRRYRALLYVAEIVAKVTYNATDTDAPFDEDSGWYVADALHTFARALNRSTFDDAAIKCLLRGSLPNERSA